MDHTQVVQAPGDVRMLFAKGLAAQFEGLRIVLEGLPGLGPEAVQSPQVVQALGDVEVFVPQDLAPERQALLKDRVRRAEVPALVRSA
jgi:hypothetical protein